MKKQILTIAALAGFVVSSVNSVMADENGVVTVTGSIGSTTCTVSTSDLNQTVPFSSIAKAVVDAAGASTLIVDAKPVNFNVTDCDKNSAQVLVTYTADPDTNHLKNNGTATGVQPIVLNKAFNQGVAPTAVDVLQSGTPSPSVNIASGAGTVSFWVGLQKRGGTVAEGTIQSSINVAMQYN